MRLVNIETQEFEEYHGQDVPPYAILSHTWGGEEVSFQEYSWLRERARELHEDRNAFDDLSPKQRHRLKTKIQGIRSKAGYSKIERFRRLVDKYDDGTSHIWIDTCCIDKTSSAELSEAINSMQFWYKRSDYCIVYLSDVSLGPLQDVDLRTSRWFTRSWTLQELLAPRRINFYDQKWKHVGRKRSMIEDLAAITGISGSNLFNNTMYRLESPAAKMSWAAGRFTTRIEDVAYCLLGLFDVHMPLLYGEGDQAFRRLQHQILAQTDDLTLLTWGYRLDMRSQVAGLLAPSPRYFLNCSDIGTLSRLCSHQSSAFQMTNKGLQITLNVCHIEETPWTASAWYALLPCSERDSQDHQIALVIAPRPRTVADVRNTDGPIFATRIGVTGLTSSVAGRSIVTAKAMFLASPEVQFALHCWDCGIFSEDKLSFEEIFPPPALPFFAGSRSIQVSLPLRNCPSFFMLRHQSKKIPQGNAQDRGVVVVESVVKSSSDGLDSRPVLKRLRVFHATFVLGKTYSLADLFLCHPSLIDPSYWFGEQVRSLYSFIADSDNDPSIHQVQDAEGASVEEEKKVLIKNAFRDNKHRIECHFTQGHLQELLSQPV